MTSVLRRHSAGIIVAILLALTLIGPRWWLLATDPASGDRAQIAPWGAGPFAYDQSLYMPNIRDAFDGRLPVTQPYGGGDRDTPAQTGAYWLQAIGSLGDVTGNIFSAFALVTTLMAVAAFLLFYAFCVGVTGSRWGALVFMMGALFFTYVMTVTGGLLALHRWSLLEPIVTVDPQLTFHPWMRFIAPILPLPSFFGVIVALPKAMETGRRSWIITAGVALAILIYSYLFYWFALAVALALWFVWLVFKRDYVSLRRMAMVGVVAGVLALPELIGLAHTSLTSNADIRARLGTGVSSPFDRPNLSILAQRFAIGLPFMAVLAIRGPERNRLFIALYVVPLVLSRAAVFLPQPGHFIDFVWPTFALPAIVAGGTEYYRMLDASWQRPALGALSVVAVALAVWFPAFQVRAERQVDPAFTIRADERAAFDWIDDNLHPGETVVSPSISTNLYLASMTPASRYILEAFVADPSDEEIIDRYLRVSAAYGLSEADAFGRIDPYDTCKPGQTTACEDTASNFPFRRVLPFDAREADLEGSMAYYLLNWEVVQPTRILDRFPGWKQSYAALEGSSNPLAGYRADYLYCGPRERLWPASEPATGIHVTVAFQQGEATLYRLVDASDPQAALFRGC